MAREVGKAPWGTPVRYKLIETLGMDRGLQRLASALTLSSFSSLSRRWRAIWADHAARACYRNLPLHLLICSQRLFIDGAGIREQLQLHRVPTHLISPGHNNTNVAAYWPRDQPLQDPLCAAGGLGAGTVLSCVTCLPAALCCSLLMSPEAASSLPTACLSIIAGAGGARRGGTLGSRRAPPLLGRQPPRPVLLPPLLLRCLPLAAGVVPSVQCRHRLHPVSRMSENRITLLAVSCSQGPVPRRAVAGR